MKSTRDSLHENLSILTDQLNSIINSKDAFPMLKNDLRGKAFLIEGILRLFIRLPGNRFKKKHIKTINNFFNLIKLIEDEMGVFSLALEIKEYAKKKVRTKKIEQMNAAITKANKDFVTFLKEKRVIKKLEKYKSELNKIPWPKKDKQHVIRSIDKERKRINLKVKQTLTPLIERKHYSLFEIEEGVHEWRRMIRWISIYIQAYTEYFKLVEDPRKISKFSNLKRKYKNSPFSKLKGGNSAIRLDAISYYKLSDYIIKISELKTIGEMNFYIKDRFNVNLPKAKKLEKKVQKLFKKYREDKVLNNLFI